MSNITSSAVPGRTRWRTERRTKAFLDNRFSAHSNEQPSRASTGSASLSDRAGGRSQGEPASRGSGASYGISTTVMSPTALTSMSGRSYNNVFTLDGSRVSSDDEQLGDSDSPGAYAITRVLTNEENAVQDAWDLSEQELDQADDVRAGANSQSVPAPARTVITAIYRLTSVTSQPSPTNNCWSWDRLINQIGGTLEGFCRRRRVTQPTERRLFFKHRWVALATATVILSFSIAIPCALIARKQRLRSGGLAVPIEKCDFHARANPDPFLQCRCFDTISAISTEVENQYQFLKKAGGPFFRHVDSGIPISACVPQNIALIWIATEIIRMGDDASDTDSGNYLHLLNRFVLACLYAAWDGLNWNDNALWLSKDSECDWYGVQCDKTGKITALSMNSNRVHGSLETRIGLLNDLKVLELADNFLWGTIPDEVWNLPKIENLSLGNNAIEGKLPLNLEPSTALIRLSLYKNEMHGIFPGGIVQLTRLRELDLNGNNFSGRIPADIGSLVALEYLDLSRTAMTGKWPESLSLLTNLKHLYMTIDGLSGTIPNSIGQMTALETLKSNYVNLIGTIPSTIGNLRNLTTLSFAFLEMSGPLPSEIGMCTLLQSLSLQGNGLSGRLPVELGHLEELSVLNLSFNPTLEGTVPGEYTDLVSIEHLFLQQTDLTGSIPSELCDGARKREAPEIVVSAIMDRCSCCKIVSE